MNNNDLLAAAPLEFECAAGTFALAVPDHELELLFQARHEAWARNRIEATKALVSAEAYQADVEVFASRRDSNRFAYAGPLSLSWLLSDAGMVEYVLLLAQKAGKSPRRETLFAMKKADPDDWQRLIDVVLRRDFPKVARELEILTATTNGSSSSSPANPGCTTAGTSSHSREPTSWA